MTLPVSERILWRTYPLHDPVRFLRTLPCDPRTGTLGPQVHAACPETSGRNLTLEVSLTALPPNLPEGRRVAGPHLDAPLVQKGRVEGGKGASQAVKKHQPRVS